MTKIDNTNKEEIDKAKTGIESHQYIYHNDITVQYVSLYTMQTTAQFLHNLNQGFNSKFHSW